MKYISIITFIIMITIPPLTTIQAQNNVSDELFSMIHSKDLFRFLNTFNTGKDNLDDWQRLYFEAWSMSVLNKCEESSRKIDEFLLKYQDKLNEIQSKLIYEARENNQLKLGMYKEASATSVYLLSKYSYLMTKDEKEEEENALIIWKACADVAPQTAAISADSHIKTKRDMAGLLNVPLSVNGIQDEFVFDTGANISTVSKSEALKLKLKMMAGTLKIGTATGIKVDGGIAVTDNLVIGNVSFKNVLFLVVSDESLSFAGGAYVINGIIGLPLIKDMKELHISDNELFVPKTPAPTDLNNLALEGFMPVIKVMEGSDTLAFNFDTGARTTILYQPYYMFHKKEIESKFTQQDIVVGGAGGDMKVKGFIIDNVHLNIGSSNAGLGDIQLAAELLKESDKYAYGNFGQDYIKQFKTMIINFESMYVDFQN